ncbi:hypothetical protein CYMTET_40961 [Cymbomonas tetramitiformis]|uniref:Uncharacterized protein n=1 Tax=Cymbomonas tetramitiformis TaxID=36881 RepID=A0AAE0C8B7_9CHLO|nr:hypothetical protein CYMTET_40961 [Cymbomonas tetramitiformis]
MEVARNCFKDGVVPECQLIDEVHDIKGWMHGCYNEVRDVSFQHAFKIFSGPTGDVLVQAKRYSFDPVWLPKEGGVKVFKSSLPEGSPCFVEPKSINELSARKQAKQLATSRKSTSNPLKEIEDLVIQCQRNLCLCIRGTFELKEKTTWVLHEAPFEVTGPMMPVPSGALSANGRDAEVLIVDESMADTNDIERGYTDAQLADYVQGLRDSVAVHVRPVPRPIYIGAQKNTIGRRARDHLAQYILGETDDPDYDVSYSKMKKGSMAVLIAPESEKTARTEYPFRIALGRSRGWSRYLYLCEVQEQLLNEKGEKCLRWLTCGTFKLTSASQKEAQNADSRLSKEKAPKPESFRLHQRTKQVPCGRKINASTQRWIPGEQYDLLVKRVIASDMSKSFEPPQHRTPKLLLRDAIMPLEDKEDKEDKENAEAEEGESSDEEASLSSLSDDDDQMCE